MKITALRTYGLASPISDWTYVKVETDEPGLHGWGECSLPGKTQCVQGTIRDLEKLTVGADPTSIGINRATNVAFGGPGRRTLCIANLGGWHISKVKLSVVGQPLAGS